MVKLGDSTDSPFLQGLFESKKKCLETNANQKQLRENSIRALFMLGWLFLDFGESNVAMRNEQKIEYYGCMCDFIPLVSGLYTYSLALRIFSLRDFSIFYQKYFRMRYYW